MSRSHRSSTGAESSASAQMRVVRLVCRYTSTSAQMRVVRLVCRHTSTSAPIMCMMSRCGVMVCRKCERFRLCPVEIHKHARYCRAVLIARSGAC